MEYSSATDENYNANLALPTANVDNDCGPNNPPWSSMIAIGVWLASVILIAILPALFVLPYLASQRTQFATSQELLAFAASDPTSLFLQILSVIPAHLITLLIAYFVITKGRRYSFTRMIGWKWGGFNVIWLIVSLVVVGLFAVMMTSVFGEADNDFLKLLRSSREIVFAVAVIATFSAPIVEELVYRGILYSAFRRSFSVPVAIIATTLIFAGIHYPQYWGDWATILTLTFLSLLLTIIREKTGNLLPCVLLHFLINGIQSLLLVLEPVLKGYIDVTPEHGFYFVRLFF
ncbi:MAG: lysostaphin resistance A-like protein [Pyrinomonadaceae bacterium]